MCLPANISANFLVFNRCTPITRLAWRCMQKCLHLFVFCWNHCHRRLIFTSTRISASCFGSENVRGGDCTYDVTTFLLGISHNKFSDPHNQSMCEHGCKSRWKRFFEFMIKMAIMLPIIVIWRNYRVASDLVRPACPNSSALRRPISPA